MGLPLLGVGPLEVFEEFLVLLGLGHVALAEFDEVFAEEVVGGEGGGVHEDAEGGGGGVVLPVTGVFEVDVADVGAVHLAEGDALVEEVALEVVGGLALGLAEGDGAAQLVGLVLEDHLAQTLQLQSPEEGARVVV